MRNLRVVLDADVLVDAQVRDVFLGLAESGLIDLRWSAALFDELRTILVDDMARQTGAADRLCRALREAFPLGEVHVGPGDAATAVAGPDVATPAALAVALACDADVVVTHERTGFPPAEALAGADVDVLTPDDALADLVDVLGADRVARVIEELTAVLDVPPADHLRRLRRLEQMAPIAAIAIGAHLDAPDYPGVLRDFLLGSRPADARATVSDLVNCVGDGDIARMEALLSGAAKAALGASDRARHRALRVMFAPVLAAPGEWRFAPSGRVVGPDAEIVTLAPVATGEGPDRPAPAHPPIVFGVVLDGARWLVDDVEAP